MSRYSYFLVCFTIASLLGLAFLASPVRADLTASSFDLATACQPAHSWEIQTSSMVAAGFFERLYESLHDSLMGSKSRMLQFGFVMMAIALWIIWWRK